MFKKRLIYIHNKYFLEALLSVKEMKEVNKAFLKGGGVKRWVIANCRGRIIGILVNRKKTSGNKMIFPFKFFLIWSDVFWIANLVNLVNVFFSTPSKGCFDEMIWYIFLFLKNKKTTNTTNPLFSLTDYYAILKQKYFFFLNVHVLKIKQKINFYPL